MATWFLPVLVAGFTPNTTKPLRIGSGRTETTPEYFFNGSLDEIRIYNRALSPTEVRQLADYAPGPIGYWKFEEGVGTTAFDSSGNNNHGVWQGTLGNQWTVGKIGTAGNFNGTTNLVSVTDNNSIDIGFQGLTISTWVKTSTTGTVQRIISKRYGGYGAGYSLYLDANGYPNIEILDASKYIISTKNTSVADGQWHHIAGSIDRLGNGYVFIDGIPNSGTSFSSMSTSDLTNSYDLVIGRFNTNNIAYFQGKLDQVKIYNYARTQKQILEDMAGSPPPGSTAKVSTPLVWYKFDEGFGSTVNNSGSIGTTLNGTLGTGSSSPTWNSGKFNKGLMFDGNDYVVTTNNLLNLSSQFSISTWINAQSGVSDQGGLIGTYGGNYLGYYLLLKLDRKPGFQIGGGNPGSGGSGNTALYSDDAISTNSWHHIVATFDGTTAKIFVDGKFKNSTLAVGATYSNQSFTIGKENHASYFFNGLIDDVKIYNYALSADEVKQDYNQGSTFVFGSSNQTIGATTTSLEYCVPGDTSPCSPPVAEWKFEEGVGTTAYDTSGNNNHGIFDTGNSAPSWTTGKIGTALSFDGTGDYISIGNTNALDMTTNNFSISAWVISNVNNYTGTSIITIKQLNNGNASYGLFWNSDNRARFFIRDATDGVDSSAYSSTLLPNVWYHLEGVVERGSTTGQKIYVNGVLAGTANPTSESGSLTNTGNFKIGYQIGNSFTRPFNGKIDQVRIYNYARTPAQIAWSYNKGAPVGHWKMDECQGTQIADWSGNNNHGTLSIGASGSQTSPGTCTTVNTATAWYNGASGKLNSSLNFDGADDRVQITDNSALNVTNQITYSLWVKNNGSGTGLYPKYILKGANQLHSNTAGTSVTWNLYVDGSLRQLTLNNIITQGVWTHISATYDGTNRTIYINGIPKLTNNQYSGQITNQTGPLYIGGSSSSDANYNGQFDDVRIYNYALTSEQIKTLYNNGSVTFR